MKKFKKILLHPATTVLAFVLAVGLLLFGSVGGARAALTYFSDIYRSQVQMHDIGVTLLENGNDVSWRNYDTETALADRENGNTGRSAEDYWLENTGELVTYMANDKLIPGKPYDEYLSVRNSGTIDQYVRVTVYKYWVDENDQKLTDLSPELIDLRLANLAGESGEQVWILDEGASTPERTVLYYNKLLPSGTETPCFADRLTISMATALKAEQKVSEDGKTIETIYTYNGVRFCLEARVDAVQDHNANAAVLSAWGKQVSVNEAAGTLSLR